MKLLNEYLDHAFSDLSHIARIEPRSMFKRLWLRQIPAYTVEAFRDHHERWERDAVGAREG